MFQLTPAQIDKVSQLVAKGEKGFKEWLAHVNTKVLDDERMNIQKQYEDYFKGIITRGVDVEVYRQVKGEFEKLLMGIGECIDRHELMAAANLVGGMLGMFWELQFCRLLGKQGLLIYWFQKWEPLGTPRFGTGIDFVSWGIPTPDVMFFTDNNCWVFGEIKHVFSLDVGEEFDGALGKEAYMLRPSEYRRIKRLKKKQPPIPYWLIIHQPERLGKWATVGELQDWIVGDTDDLGKAVLCNESPYGRTTWVNERGAYHWAKEAFTPLKDKLEQT
ncbi:MAG: hypothetical protein MUO80_00540 [Dehalococcoidia bacterium]|nr:hypothetical protein [Dehalococcoidia bacterium]